MIIGTGDTSVDASLAGHDWASAVLTPYTLVDGCQLAGSGQIALDSVSAQRARVSPGDRVQVTVAGTPREFEVTGVAKAQVQVDAPALFFSADDARRFSVRVDAIGIIPAAGTDLGALADRIGKQLPPGLTILTGDDRGAAEFTGVAGSQLPLIILAATCPR